MPTTSKIAVINPNTTAAMTETIARAARQTAQPTTEILELTSATGPVSIEGFYDEALSLPGLLEAIGRAEREAVTGHVIACFDDTGLDAARQLAAAPVVGIGEAGYHAACLVAGRFAVVTTTALSVTALEHNILRYGFERRCAGVRSANVPVLELENASHDAVEAVSREIALAIEADRAEAIVLGCAGMADLQKALAERFACPIIDGVRAAVGLIEMLNQSGASTSRLGGYAPRNAKAITGSLSGLGAR